MRRLALLAALLLAGCGPSPASTAPTSPPSARVPVEATAPTAVPTARPESKPTSANYVALRQQLLVPLEALIEATRDNNPNAAQHLASFNTEADQVIRVTQGDVSEQANRLSSAIVNTREAAGRRDLATLERIRVQLLEVR